ncbi:MAG: type III-B CRISPR module RAMP protein Cmr4 [Candidatus Helarchaeota archaeon]
MFEKSLVAYIYAETPVHPGSGTAISGIIDLPIQRERYTEFPMIQGSSLKGVLRNSACLVKLAGEEQCKKCKDKDVEKCDRCQQIFGKKDHVGGISVTDARILAFPVRTLKGVFGWVTCPIVLDRYKRDLKIAGIEVNWGIPKPEKDEEAIVQKNSNLKAENYIYIEELQLEAKEDKNQEITNEIVKGLPNSGYEYIKEKLNKDMIIVSDTIFRDIVSLTTEVVARIKIKPETGTVQRGGLWYEEYLPTDTLMYSLILIPNRLNYLKPEDVETEIKKYSGKPLQMGGDETIGKGFVRIKLFGKEDAKNAQES